MRETVRETVRERLYRREPVFSFEFFPPKDEKGAEGLRLAMAELAPLEPAFVSVTCGAAGSTRDLTRDVVCSLQDRYAFGVMAHITAIGYSRAELREVIRDYRRNGIRSFLALRGDPPRDNPSWRPPADQLEHARDVVELVASETEGTSVGVAGYPEVHPEAAGIDTDLAFLKAKVDAGADFVVTQMFFDNDAYFTFVHQARKAGILVPILPGVMPITRPGQIERFETLCRVAVPESLRQILASNANSERFREIGVSFATAQCADLLRRGAPGVHFFTLNQSRACHTVYASLKAMGW